MQGQAPHWMPEDGAHLENTTVPFLKLFTDKKGRQCHAGRSAVCLERGTDEVSSEEAEVTPDGNQGWALTIEE